MVEPRGSSRPPVAVSDGVAAPTTDSLSGDVSPPEDAGCPTPLAWQQVVEAFGNERRLHRVKFDGETLRVWTLGEGPPLYLLNGFLGDETLLALLVWLLREDHTCVICDRPSAGIGSKRDAWQQLQTLARSVQSVGDALGHDRFAIHATSLGCLVALQVMLDAPGRVSRAALQGGFAARRFSWWERRLLSLGRLTKRTIGRLGPAVAIQRHNHRHWFPPFDHTRWDFYERQCGLTPIRRVAQDACLAGQVDLRPRLPEITTPVLIINSEGDGRVSRHAQQELAAGMPRVRIEDLDNCGALPHITHPHRLAKLLREFRDETKT